MKDVCTRSDAALTPHWPAVAGIALLGSAVLLMRFLPLPWFAPLTLLIGLPWLGRWRITLMLGVLVLCVMAWRFEQSWQQRLPVEVADASLRGVVIGPVQPQGAGYRFAFRPDNDSRQLRISWFRTAQRPVAGQCWEFELRLRPPRGSVNPGSFDYEAWLFREAYAGRGSVRAGRACGPMPAPGWRRQLQTRWEELGSQRARATLGALLLGERDGMSEQDWLSLRRTGTSHLFAISGLHLGLVAGCGWLLGWWSWKLLLWRWLPRARDPAVVLAAGMALAYAAISGFGVPVQRALVMCLVGLILLLTGRRRPLLDVLGLAAVLVLVLDPLAVLSPGFWLSFGAVLAMLLHLRRYPELPQWLRLVAIQLWLSIALLPAVWWFFGGVAWLSPLVNLLLLPLFGLLLPGLMLAVLAEALIGWGVPLQALMGLVDSLWQGLDWLADLPVAYTQLPALGWWTAVCTLGGLCVLGLGRGHWRLGGLGLLLPLSLAAADRPDLGEFRVWFWDVGQGQSVLIQTAEADLLYDAGPAWPGGFDAGERIVVPALQALGVRQLRRLVVSHQDTDHAGGTRAVMAAFPGVDAVHRCRAGQNWLWDGVRFEILHPEAGRWSDNNGSCVLRVISAAGRSVLLTGDIEATVERRLLAQGMPLRADVLSVPHHGSASSSTMEFVARVAPEVAVVSAGWRNRWAFPREPVMARYRSAGAKLLNTAHSGAIRIDVGAGLQIRALRAESPRLWRYSPAQF